MPAAAAPLDPSHILQTGLGFWPAKTLLAAVELGVFATLADGPLERAPLAERIGLHPRSAADFLDALVALRLLDRADGRYANTAETAHFLDPARPGYVGGMLTMADRRLYPFWGNLAEALRTGQPQNEGRDGGDPFTAIYAEPATLATFLGAMTGASLPTAAKIAEAFPWADYGSFADVGCAQGAFPVTVAARHPHLSAIGFDLPPVGPVFEAFVARHGLGDRVSFQPGSFFTDPLPAADVLVMGHILHDWDLPTKRMLVEKAHAALAPGGALLVYDTMIDDQRRENAFGLLMSLNMLIETPGGFDYTGADCAGWLAEAGFRDVRVERLPGPHAMAIGVK